MSYQKDHSYKADCSTACAWNQNGCLVAKALIAVTGSEILESAQVTKPKFRPPSSAFPWGDQ
jgi:hypothetical protein